MNTHFKGKLLQGMGPSHTDESCLADGICDFSFLTTKGSTEEIATMAFQISSLLISACTMANARGYT
jgi:hypothetical protein